MIRRIIQIDEELCNGCKACITACHEGAIQMVNGKAKLMRDDYCDGLGDCLPFCPTNAISFVEREAASFNEVAVKNYQSGQACPGTISKNIKPVLETIKVETIIASQLQQWPVQIQLVPVNTPYFDKSDVLIAADCSAYAYANFHTEFMKDKITLIGCPKLDPVDYTDKLTAILEQNHIHSMTVVRMEVPCCGGIEYAVQSALQNSRKIIPLQVKTISIEGEILEEVI